MSALYEVKCDEPPVTTIGYWLEKWAALVVSVDLNPITQNIDLEVSALFMAIIPIVKYLNV